MHRATQKRRLARRSATLGADPVIVPQSRIAGPLRTVSPEHVLAFAHARHAEVPSLASRLRDLMRVRGEMESRAAAWATPNLSAVHCARLQELTGMMARASDGSSYGLHHRDFHFGIYRACGSETLLDIIEKLWAEAAPYPDLLYGPRSKADEVHKRILGAIRDGDADGCGRYVREEIEASAATVLNLLDR